MTVEEVELAAPGPGEVEVRISAAGVCHSDWNVVTGATTNPFPTVLGHEGAGVVVAVGEGVETVAEGDHIVLSWLPACGRCFYCSRGRQALCDLAMADMFRGTLPGGALRLSQDGEPLYHYSYLSAFAESCVVPEGCCVVIRDDAPLEVAALVGCAVMTGYGAVVNRARVAPGSVVVVFTMDAEGKITRIDEVRNGSSEEGARACVSAITVPSPYGTWTNEMIAVLGLQQQLTFTFYYRE